MIIFAIDLHFRGITVLSSPSTGNHPVDLLVVPGLDSYPHGSFVWISDGHVCLPRYQSASQDSTSFAALNDLGLLRVEFVNY